MTRRSSDEYTDYVTTRFGQCCVGTWLVKPGSVNYAVELAQLGLDSMSALAIVPGMEKSSTFVFPATCSLKVAFYASGRLKEAVQLLRAQQQS